MKVDERKELLRRIEILKWEKKLERFFATL